jgi:hypothetical protein
LNEVNDQDDDSNYEQEMDQAAANVADEAQKPENDQDHNYGPEHGYPFGWVKLSSAYLFRASSIRQAFSEHRRTNARNHPCGLQCIKIARLHGCS